MKRKILIPILCCLLLCLGAGLALAAPSVKISGSKVTVEEGVTDAIMEEIKKGVGEAKGLEFTLRKLNANADLEKICAAYPDMVKLEVGAGDGLTSLAPVAKLTKLQSLTITAPSVTDLSPLSGLTELTYINIDAKSAGPDLKWMSGLVKLSQVRFDAGENLVSFEGIPSVPNFRNITITGAAPADLTPLTAFSGLRTLNLDNCVIADLTPLASLARLDMLNLRGAKVKDFSPLAGCRALKTLWVGRTQEADYATLGKLVNLTELKTGATAIDTISWISGLTKLKTLAMSSENITDYSPLAGLQLEELELWSMEAEVIDLGFLSGMTSSMKKLALDELTGVSNLNVLPTLSSLTSLSIVKLGVKGGEAIPIDQLKKLPNLEELTISRDVFTDAQLTGFANSNISINQR